MNDQPIVPILKSFLKLEQCVRNAREGFVSPHVESLVKKLSKAELKSRCAKN